MASGDRRIAQLLLAALRHAGHQPFVVSRLRSFDGSGDPARQAWVAGRGQAIAARLLQRWRQFPIEMPDLWFTYHLYYKAPDRIGPPVSAALGIPYAVAEASHAEKRAGGPWAAGHRAVADALRRAAAVIGLNSADRDGVLPLLADPQRWHLLPPFLDARRYTAPPRARNQPPRLIAVAMMRQGDKLASYRLLGEALTSLLDLTWRLDVVGDGPARAEVEQVLAPLSDRVAFLGALGEDAVAAALERADLGVWPAINEAFGMALLEVQASGLPVVAGRYGGVGDIVADGCTGILTSPGDAVAFAAALRRLLLHPETAAAMGQAARAKVLREHDLPVAAACLAQILEPLGRVRAA